MKAQIKKIIAHKKYRYSAITTAALIIFIAVVVVYIHTPTKKANAQTAAPTISIAFDQGSSGVIQSSGQTSVSNGQLTISSAGPFTEDFQIQVCVTSVNAPYQFCGTTPWASQAGSSTAWSPWVWPGYNNGLNLTTPGLITLSVNTRPLPVGATLTNVVLGLGIAEANGGPNSLASNIVQNSPCDYGFTPTAGGSTPNVYGYVYGNCPSTWQTNPAQSASGAPDDIQVGIRARVNNVSFTSTLPSQMTVGQTITSSTITVTNLANLPFGNENWTELANGPGTPGDNGCTTDPDENGVDTMAAGGQDPNTYAPITGNCGISVNITTDLLLTHTGAFTTPATLPYTIDNVWKYSLVAPTYSQFSDSPDCSTGGGYGNGEYGYNDGYGDGAGCYYSIPGYSITTYNGVSSDEVIGIAANGGMGTFAINPFTAPSTPGTYDETWTLSDSSGTIGSYTKTIQVGGSASTSTPAVTLGTINVSSTNAATADPISASWWVSGLTTVSTTGQTAATYSNLPTTDPTGLPVPYIINPISGSAGSLFSFGGIQKENIAEAKSTNVITRAFSSIANSLTSVALADDTCDPNDYTFDASSGQYICQGGDVNSLPLLPAYGNNANFIILWDPIATVSVTPSSVQLINPSQLSQQVQIQNSGASGSVLNWTANTTSTWISLSATSGTGVPSGGSSPLTLTADPSGLANGTTGVVSIQGTSENCTAPIAKQCDSSASTSVTFTIGSTNPGGASSTNPGGATSTNPGGSTSTNPGSSTSTSQSGMPSCALTATPSSITPGQSSKLSYSCENVSSCHISGGQFGSYATVPVSGGTASGSTSVSPSANTIYSLSCDNGVASATAQVTVSNPGLNETNP